MIKIKRILGILKWRLKPCRYILKVFYRFILGSHVSISKENLAINTADSFSSFDMLGYAEISNSISFNIPITKEIEQAHVDSNQAFVNVSDYFWPELKELITKILSNKEVELLIADYFDNKPWLWNVAANCSTANSNELTDSQFWHFDYGDKKQLHFMYYLTDVDELAGPFTFLDAKISRRIQRNPFLIERFDDEKLLADYDVDTKRDAIKLTGKKGSLFVADPGRVFHQGARSQKTRVVIFITVTSGFPMSLARNHTINEEKRTELHREYVRSGANVLNERFFV